MNKFALLAALALSVGAVQASETSIGFDAGRSSLRDNGGEDYGGWSLYAGTRLHPNVLAEAGYRRLGRDSMGGVTLRGHAWQASLVGQLPVSEVARLYVRLGVNRVQVEASGFGVRVKEHETEGLYGLGVEYSLSKRLNLRTEFQKPSSDTSVATIGLRLSF